MKNWKKQTGVWIDSSEAVIITLFDGGENVTEIKSGIYYDDEIDKGASSRYGQEAHHYKYGKQNNNQLDHFLDNVISQVKESDELFIFGPAETKTKLHQKIYDEHLIDYRKLKSVQATNKMTPSEILANVKEFYKN
ncbi:hypothetical protein [Flavobacterium luteum]|uniref:Host attachment protein n=1 Tax=Flavobacterium luteum TaxID=2026654 RepID=A0A7J5ADE1_9FLAO|nr:hypothetical protein [Flavobacterium luteum]KAB1155582.1 hypothetical protein F6464_10735 [Flavobacterium luteum]